MKCMTCGSRDCRTTETRETLGGILVRRRKHCLDCGAKFNSYEVYESLWSTIKRYATPHAAAVAKRWALRARNEQIKARLLTGEKCETIGLDFGLSPSMVATVSRRLGLPRRGPGGARKQQKSSGKTGSPNSRPGGPSAA